MARAGAATHDRAKNDLYRTSDPNAVKALLPHLAPGSRFYEPCAGHGDLVFQLIEAGHTCVGALDIEPPEHGFWLSGMDNPAEHPIQQGDAREFYAAKHWSAIDLFITNPTWTRPVMHQIIMHLYWQRPLWLLFDARWAHTDQARPYMPLCRKIVSVGRLRWFEGTPHKDTNDAAWHLFAPAGSTEFIGRAA
jgi:hypothetical protein